MFLETADKDKVELNGFIAGLFTLVCFLEAWNKDDCGLRGPAVVFSSVMCRGTADTDGGALATFLLVTGTR